MAFAEHHDKRAQRVLAVAGERNRSTGIIRISRATMAANGYQNFAKCGDKAHALVARMMTSACRGLNITTIPDPASCCIWERNIYARSAAVGATARKGDGSTAPFSLLNIVVWSAIWLISFGWFGLLTVMSFRVIWD